MSLQTPADPPPAPCLSSGQCDRWAAAEWSAARAGGPAAARARIAAGGGARCFYSSAAASRDGRADQQRQAQLLCDAAGAEAEGRCGVSRTAVVRMRPVGGQTHTPARATQCGIVYCLSFLPPPCLWASENNKLSRTRAALCTSTVSTTAPAVRRDKAVRRYVPFFTAFTNGFHS